MAYAPQNTMAALALSHRLGVKAVELDVQMTSDEHIVVFHDPMVDVLTDGTGLVHNMTLSGTDSIV